jgi:hypothetical protein
MVLLLGTSHIGQPHLNPGHGHGQGHQQRPSKTPRWRSNWLLPPVVLKTTHAHDFGALHNCSATHPLQPVQKAGTVIALTIPSPIKGCVIGTA